MFKQIRTMLADDDAKVGGNVEVDEMYFGGVRKGKHGRLMTGDHDKPPVLGMVERNTPERKGRVVARVVGDTKSKTLA